MPRFDVPLRLAALAVLCISSPAVAGGLDGSHASMIRQHDAAIEAAFRFAKTPAQVETFVGDGQLERVTSNADLALSDVSFPYAHHEVRLFVERLAAQYHESTGARLVVTSLTRPASRQPRNASPLSVHPAGMAVDLRVPADAAARAWLVKTLLSMEDAGVVDVTRERRPSHLHIAVFPEAYRAYAARDSAARASGIAPSIESGAIAPAPAASTHADAERRGAANALLVAGLLAIGCTMSAIGAGAMRVTAPTT
jgi:hypothetical protein